MTPEVQAWVAASLSRVDVAGQDVLEVGSLDVNGSVRPYGEGLGPRSYRGVDITRGPGVDEVVAAEDLLTRYKRKRFGVVISTEMLEHAEHWRDALWAMMAVTTSDGLMLVTTRSPGFPRHDWPSDHWRYTYEDVIWLWSCWQIEDVRPDPFHPGVFIRARKLPQWEPVAARERMDRLSLVPAP